MRITSHVYHEELIFFFFYNLQAFKALKLNTNEGDVTSRIESMHILRIGCVKFWWSVGKTLIESTQRRMKVKYGKQLKGHRDTQSFSVRA